MTSFISNESGCKVRRSPAHNPMTWCNTFISDWEVFVLSNAIHFMHHPLLSTVMVCSVLQCSAVLCCLATLNRITYVTSSVEWLRDIPCDTAKFKQMALLQSTVPSSVQVPGHIDDKSWCWEILLKVRKYWSQLKGHLKMLENECEIPL